MVIGLLGEKNPGELVSGLSDLILSMMMMITMMMIKTIRILDTYMANSQFTKWFR